MAQPLGRHHDKTRTSWTPAGPSSAAQSMWPVSLRGPFLNALDRLLTPVECELHHRGQNIPSTHPRAKHHNLNSRPFFLLRWHLAGHAAGQHGLDSRPRLPSLSLTVSASLIAPMRRCPPHRPWRLVPPYRPALALVSSLSPWCVPFVSASRLWSGPPRSADACRARVTRRPPRTARRAGITQVRFSFAAGCRGCS